MAINNLSATEPVVAATEIPKVGTWNYRLLAKEHKGEWEFKICEVYYNLDGVPKSHTENAIRIVSDDVSGIKWQLNRMAEALKKPVLFWGDKFPKECAITYKCDWCGRDKFTAKTPHICATGVIRKRHLSWTTIVDEKP